MPKLILIINDIRSAYNVGSLLRTAEGLGLDKVFLTGITPYPQSKDDHRLPHVGRKVHQRIAKTALGAEDFITWEWRDDLKSVVGELRNDGFKVIALEQTADSISLSGFKYDRDLALIVGNEVMGLSEEALKLSDLRLMIPMAGQKESFNVSVAAAMALYHLKFSDTNWTS